jgi:hypothetical protein
MTELDDKVSRSIVGFTGILTADCFVAASPDCTAMIWGLFSQK